MRTNLITAFLLSIFILGVILLITIYAGEPKNSIIYQGPLEAENFTPAFSQGLSGSKLLNVFGSPKITLIVFLTVSILVHSKYVYKLLKFKKAAKKASFYGTYWAVLFIPYILLLVISL